MHPAVAEILKFFKYEHLGNERLKIVSRHFCELAEWVATSVPDCAEKTVTLRKLLEAKDAAVRASLPKE